MVAETINHRQVRSGFLAAALTFAVSWVPAADAAEVAVRAGETGRAPFSVHDIDQDGYLSRSEFEVFRRELKARAGRGRRHYRGLPGPLTFEEIDTDAKA